MQTVSGKTEYVQSYNPKSCSPLLIVFKSKTQLRF